MPKKVTPTGTRRGFPPPSINDHPLLRVLIAEATRRGDTLATMARHLDVSYERVAQWRRKEADVANAGRAFIEAAGQYLGIPTAYVLCLAGVVRLEDFVAPGPSSMRERVRRDLVRLRHDPHFAGFFPEALLSADASVQRFVAWLYRELGGGVVRGDTPFEWMRSLQLAAMGDAQAKAELALLKGEQR